MSLRTRTHAGGFTLIELVISIVIIGASVVGVAGALSASATGSAQSMVRQQASGIANAYLAEILSLPYNDPAGADNETTRPTFDDVDDYNALPDNVPRDRTGAALTGLGQFTVAAVVADINLAAGMPAKRVDVTVRCPDGYRVIATGFRTNHP